MGHISSSSIATTLAVLLLMVALPLAFAACGGSDDGVEAETTMTTQAAGTDEVQVAMSELTRLAPAASDADVRAAASSLQAFGIDLYGILATEAGEGNLVFSPSSIVTALAMTHAGAAGATAEEMAATLHFTLEGDALHQAFNSLDTALESRSWSKKDPEGKEWGVLVKTANSLWGQNGITFEKLFLDTLASNYGAGMRLVDYMTAAEEARVAINRWVAGETNDKIPELIPQGTLDALTRLVLVNAVYLDATWQLQFDPDMTKDGQFTTLAGDVVTTPMMTQKEMLPYAAGDGWRAVELAYVGDELAMTLIVPDEGRFEELEDLLAAGLLDEVAGEPSSGAAEARPLTQVQLTMPKFEFRTQTGLSAALAALGIRSAFSPGEADFSGMTTEEPLFISDVIHEAYIAVDEEGTEAAAATAVVMRASGMPPSELVELTIDRPFMFALRDRETGAVLFLGRLTDPTT
ncbi:MAG: serpin family protein [Thermoleophilia bacterium]|nr:serpin family protein [Thermoleophilia bacterium]